MEDDDGRVVLVDILDGTETAILVRLLVEFRLQQHVLGAVLAHGDMLAAVHSGEVYGTRPVAGGIHGTALVEIVADSAFQVDVNSTHLGLLQTRRGSGDRRQVTTGRESAGGDERRVELVLRSLTTHEADDGTDVVNLGRPLGIDAAAVVGAYDGIACIQQRLADGAEVGHALAAVAEPGTAVDVDDDGVGGSLLFGQVDVTGVVGLVVAGIVDVLPLLRGFQFRLLLEAAKASGRLCHARQRQAEHHS